MRNLIFILPLFASCMRADLMMDSWKKNGRPKESTWHLNFKVENEDPLVEEDSKLEENSVN